MTSHQTDEYFFVNPDWITDAICWTPSVLFGLPANLFVVFLGGNRTTRSLGNFRLAINCVCIVNSLHCLSRAVVLAFYFAHYLFALETSIIPCTIIANYFKKWMGYYIVFFIPLLSGYRFVLLCVRNSEKYLTKANLLFTFGVIITIPTGLICGRLVEMLSEAHIDTDSICGYKYSDWNCKWCRYFVSYISYTLYLLSFLFSTATFVHLWRSFHRIGSSGISSRRLTDEFAILVCVVIQTIVPVILTLPANGQQLLKSLGFGRVGSTLAGTLYNYNPVFDALLIMAFIKPYRLTLLEKVRMWRHGRAESVTGRNIVRRQHVFNVRAADQPSPLSVYRQRMPSPKRDGTNEIPRVYI